jgi:hypothetical protein
MKYQDNPEVPGPARNVLGTSAFLSQGLDVVQTGSLRASATVYAKCQTWLGRGPDDDATARTVVLSTYATWSLRTTKEAVTPTQSADEAVQDLASFQAREDEADFDRSQSGKVKWAAGVCRGTQDSLGRSSLPEGKEVGISSVRHCFWMSSCKF